MKKFYCLTLIGVMFFGIGWIFIRTTWTLVGVLICACAGWVAMKIEEERS